MLSDTVKCKLVISHNEDKNLNSQRRLKAKGHIFIGDTIFFLGMIPVGEIIPSL